MNIVTSIQTIPGLTQNNLIPIKDFLVNKAGWTVVGSGDGVTGGMDYDDGYTDRIGSDVSKIVEDSWFVLESPHTDPNDRVQILFNRPDHYTYRLNFKYNPEADYTHPNDDSPELPTSNYDVSNWNGSFFTSSTADSSSARVHMLADTDAPYGFAIMAHAPRDVATERYAFAFVPFNLSTSTDNPGKPYAIYCSNTGACFYQADMERNSNPMDNGNFIAQSKNPPSVPVVSTAVTFDNGSGQIIPNGLDADEERREQGAPVIFMVSSQFFGVSDFIRWNGISRRRLDTFEGPTGPRERIIFGDVSFPWDGETIPVQ